MLKGWKALRVTQGDTLREPQRDRDTSLIRLLPKNRDTP